MGRKIRFGVNYTPSKNWYYMWEDGYIADCIDEDFAAISSLGMDHIRLQLRWDIFQTDSTHFSSQSFLKLAKILDTAKKYLLDVEICVFTGWLSGFWFLPQFLKGSHILCDKQAIAAECNFLAELAKEFGTHSAFIGIDLGNEINMFASLKGMNFSRQDGDDWFSYMSEYCKAKFEGKDIVLGVDHQPYFFDEYFSRQCLNNCGTATTLHTWSKFTGALDDGGILGAKTRWLALMNCEMAVAYMENPSRDIHLQEFGVTQAWANEEEIPAYIRETVTNSVSCQNVKRFTYWCSHDINKNHAGFDNIEYDLGLFDCNNRLKAQGKIFGQLSQELRAAETDTRPKMAIVIRDGIDTHLKQFGWYYGEPFVVLSEKGIPATFVLAENIGNTEYLRKRNIRQIIEVEDI